MRASRTWWSIYTACAVVVIVALVWITLTLVGLERSESIARADARYQESLRLALWRMDSWLSPQLAIEAARPYADYQPFYTQEAYFGINGLAESDGVFTPSPLLNMRAGIFRLHFQLTPEGSITSPQVPVGSFRELAETSHLDAAQIDYNATLLALLRTALSPPDLSARLNQEMKQLFPDSTKDDSLSDTDELEPVAKEQPPATDRIARVEESSNQSYLSAKEFSKRQRSTAPSLSNSMQSLPSNEPNAERETDADIANVLLSDEESTAILGDRRQTSSAPTAVVGPLQPIWLDGFVDDTRELVYFRRVLLEGQTYYQGFLCDWPRIRTTLLDQILDLFGIAELIPRQYAPINDTDLATLLTAVPASLQTATFSPVPVDLFSPTRITLLISWLAVLSGLVAVAVTLRSVVAYGDKRSRFASAVTHELRTPLTTFRMYTEMLSTGMVPDEDKRRAYLATLNDEAGRLSSLVENVLEFARLEEGRRPAIIEAVSVDELLSSAMPPLERRAEEAGVVVRSRCRIDGDRKMRTDVNVVGQILLNLVDNACKYAGNKEDNSIDVEILEHAGELCMRVHDSGAGVPVEQARLIFSPFERGANQGSAKPGIGLGLSLSRGLARDLGGNLILESGDKPGACFRLSLPGLQ